MEVFNKSINKGTQQGANMPSSTGNQSSVLDGTASATGNSQGSMDGSMGQNEGTGMQSGSTDQMGGQTSSSSGSGMEGMETGGDNGSGTSGNGTFANIPGTTGSGQQSGNGSISGGYGQFPGSTDGSMQGAGTGYGNSGRRIIIIGDNSGVMTDEERVQQYDRDLEEQMQVFDGIILGRRQETIARTNEEGAGNIDSSAMGSGGGFGGDNTFESAPLLTTASASASADPNRNRTGGALPDAPGDNREGDYQNQSGENSNLPPDIGDGSDDDIVARQLREAALAEKDPELKEKLWDEYRKYKQGVQARR
jgi:hypothetical protein